MPPHQGELDTAIGEQRLHQQCAQRPLTLVGLLVGQNVGQSTLGVVHAGASERMTMR